MSDAGAHAARAPGLPRRGLMETGASREGLSGMRPGYLAANTILYCREFAATCDFYRHGLGLEPGFSNEWFVEFVVLEGAALSIADESRCSVKSGAGRGITITLRVADVAVAHRQLAARGTRPGPVRAHPWGARVFHLHDPEGHRVEIWSQP